MNRTGKVYINDIYTGKIIETDDGYSYEYDDDYLKSEKALPVSLTLPLENKIYKCKTMIPFFDGLIPEGWLLDIAAKNWKLDPKDRMGLLLTCCVDCIGSVSIIRE
ncbi:MAG TPA: HipA N-terminal domain-containing protein [Spirochaetota bacterium]|jgi:serine/threonine-protein kinase HipA|nr:MAG: Serine/threonine-protein kinase HipA [Spirochaetes bacterium ADurb.Bin133]HNZ28204.1 HipA N-terminal domain-containing protein [Spirochaetota bacterium]HPY87636.1 HipA N-terminal domain-containing protein [Spirochaetota bacterium]HQB61105.1 HipA N-terminal domain-containing protein [Spirochaetota bacterium]